jgi:hypothetical protein
VHEFSSFQAPRHFRAALSPDTPQSLHSADRMACCAKTRPRPDRRISTGSRKGAASELGPTRRRTVPNRALRAVTLCLPESQSGGRHASSRDLERPCTPPNRLFEVADTDVSHISSLIAVNAAADVRGRHGCDVHRKRDGWVLSSSQRRDGECARARREAHRAFRPRGVRNDGEDRRLQRSPRCRRHRAA